MVRISSGLSSSIKSTVKSTTAVSKTTASKIAASNSTASKTTASKIAANKIAASNTQGATKNINPYKINNFANIASTNVKMPAIKDNLTISYEAKRMQNSAKSDNILDKAKDFGSSSIKWLKDAGKFITNAVKDGIDWLVLDDVKTLFNPNAGVNDKGLALVSLFPAGKVVKGGKLANSLTKSGKGSSVNAFEGLGKVLLSNKKGILMEGDKTAGWEHIKGRHITGTLKGKGKVTTLFPKNLSESKIKALIMDSVKHGTVKEKQKDGNIKYTYNPKKYGITTMETIVDKHNIIISSYPTKGSSVRTIKK